MLAESLNEHIKYRSSDEKDKVIFTSTRKRKKSLAENFCYVLKIITTFELYNGNTSIL